MCLSWLLIHEEDFSRFDQGGEVIINQINVRFLDIPRGERREGLLNISSTKLQHSGCIRVLCLGCTEPVLCTALSRSLISLHSS